MRFALLAPAALLFAVGCSSTPPPKPIARPTCAPATPGEDPARVVDRFYTAFSRKDFPAMACTYHPEVEFTDSIFGTLRGKRALAMWAMLTSSPRPLDLKWRDIRVDGARATAHWDARYKFPFGFFDNDVVNSIDASFELKDGKIWRHRDRFDLDKWMHMALSPLGGVISEGTIKEQVQVRLNEFIEANPDFR